jgi:hypothetical protein
LAHQDWVSYWRHAPGDCPTELDHGGWCYSVLAAENAADADYGLPYDDQGYRVIVSLCRAASAGPGTLTYPHDHKMVHVAVLSTAGVVQSAGDFGGTVDDGKKQPWTMTALPGDCIDFSHWWAGPPPGKRRTWNVVAELRAPEQRNPAGRPRTATTTLNTW